MFYFPQNGVYFCTVFSAEIIPKCLTKSINVFSPNTTVLLVKNNQPHSFIHSLACAECNDTLPFSGASSIPLCCVLFPSTLFHQLVFHPSSLCLAICFLVYLSALFPSSYTILFWEFYFFPFSVHAQTNVIYLAL